ncbi:MAG TPA: NAD(P)/FAD-dependent oxidoreductase [Thermoleophilaceae bacterium]|nr:NAD(P)/FAD-dependent oxidoreductase [Thermoleophilaceae bacterium]
MSRHVDIAIVGSGFAGLAAAYRLKQAGIEDFTILERADGVGGTWWANTYPGCQCDVASHLYSLSFAPNPNWTRTYSMQPEIQAYLQRTAEELDLVRYISFGHEVTNAAWDDDAGRWQLDTAAGPVSARVVIGGQGGLSEPRIPDFEGRDTFAGASFHSAAWDDSVDLRGKRVAVLGTGASAIQIVPSIQPEVGRLKVFQRTPPWVIPHTDRPTTRLERALYRRFPALQRAVRRNVYWMREWLVFPLARKPALLKPLEMRAVAHIKKAIKDPELRRKLIPNYRIGCKRILPSNRWYPALAKPNVDVLTSGIDRICPEGIVTADGELHEVDVIVYATGFHVTDIPFGDRVKGRAGRTLAETWDGSPQAYKGSAVPGFPNLFLLLGPNTGLGHNSIVYMIESQVTYVVDAVRKMAAQGTDAVEVREDSFRRWNDGIQRRMPPTVWSSGGCASWYVDRNGRNTTLWPDWTWRFRRLTKEFDMTAYEAVSSPRGPASGPSDVHAAVAGGLG